MPRQPYLRLHKEGTEYKYAIGAGELAKQPEHAAIIGQCIAMWTEVEIQMSLAFGAIIRTNSDTSVALYLALKNSSTQRNILSTIARPLLDSNVLDIYDALMILYSSRESERNNLAHGTFGISEEFPDAVVWCNMQDYSHFIIDLLNKEYNKQYPADPHKKLRESLYVYRLKDLEMTLRDLTELEEIVMWFHFHHQPREPRLAEDYLAKILSYSSIKNTLNIVKQKQAAQAAKDAVTAHDDLSTT